MRKIDKQAGFEPTSLRQFKRRHKQGNYSDLTSEIRQDIRLACTTEQFYLCAYCCKPISGDSRDTMNEHVEARKTAPNRSLDYTNIVASCTTPNQCDDAHGSQPLPLTPFDAECETDLVFKLSGRVTGLTDDAKETIRVLNLDNKSLIEQRSQFVQALLLGGGVDPDDVIDDSDLIQMVINDLAQPQDGKLEAFTPVVINILRGWLDD
ncbi:hypothetical protein [Psychrobacter halodurans]|uniref:hypothetical protein n=1 Tax=Psychrobacter halodurans TaxID=2818439 RepID=UPI001FB12F57|nr:hypothetical protein [Psychrobacter halodurans]